MTFHSIRPVLSGAVIASVLFANPESRAYNESTHQRLTEAAVTRSILADSSNTSLLAELGLVPSLNQTGYSTFTGSPPYATGTASLLEAVKFGAKEEDNVTASNSLNHFFDPQHNGEQGRPLQLIPFVSVGATSRDWVMERIITYPAQYYSFPKAQAQLANALTATSPASRMTAFGRVFQSLGHIAHHIQDMAQPQHVRNEPHLHVEQPFQYNSAASAYESYTQTKINPDIFANISSGVWPSYPIPTFADATSYWNTSPAGYIGMAEFTAKNSLTFTTGLAGIASDANFVADAPTEFPLPKGFNSDNSLYGVREEDTLVYSLSKFENIPLRVRTLSAKVIDGNIAYAGSGVTIGSTSADVALESISPTVRLLFTGNSTAVWNSQYPILLPRAIAFSAGIVNHFFRGRVGFSRITGTSNWTLKNPTAYQLSGSYDVYTEDANGNRSFYTTLKVGNSSAITLGANSSTTVSLAEPTTSPSKLVVVFKGYVGTEADRVAGIVVPFNALPTPTACGGPYYDGPSQHSFGNITQSRTAPNTSYSKATLELGSTAGTVNVSLWLPLAPAYALNSTQYAAFLSSPFGAGSNPGYSLATMSETMTITSGGAAVASSGFSAGSGTLSFYHNPTATGSTKVTITETFPYYAYVDVGATISPVIRQVSCPGGGLDANRGLRTISFGVTAKTGQMACGKWTFTVNGNASRTVPSGTSAYIKATHNASDFPTCSNTSLSVSPGTPWYNVGSGNQTYTSPKLVYVP